MVGRDNAVRRCTRSQCRREAAAAQVEHLAIAAVGIEHHQVGQGHVANVGHRDAIAERRAIGIVRRIKPHGRGGFLAIQVRAERQTTACRKADHLLVNLDLRRALDRARGGGLGLNRSVAWA